jgi:hypothetical protein
MRTLSRIALAGVCFALVAMAQNDRDRYTVPVTVSLSGNRTITLVSGGKQLELEQISVQPTGGAGVTVAIERDCSGVNTATALTPAAINAESAPAGRPLFHAYDNTSATGCSALSPAWSVPEGALLAMPSAKTYAGASGKNINVRISSVSGSPSGTLRLQITLTEAR